MKRASWVAFALLATVAIAGCDNGSTDTSKDKEPVKYSVTYDANGNTGGTAPSAQVKTESVDLVLDANSGSLARKSCVFAGWNTAADGTGTDYASGAKYALNADLKLYAKWTVSPTLKIGFIPWGESFDWLVTHNKSMQDAIKAKNYTPLVADHHANLNEQIAAIRSFIDQKADIILLEPTSDTGWTTVLGEAKTAGIPIVLVDRTMTDDPSLYAASVNYNPEFEGKTIADTLIALKGNAPVKILEIIGTSGDASVVGRKKGFDDAIAGTSYTIIDHVNGNYSRATAKSVTDGEFKKGTDFNVVFAHNDDMAIGAIEAIEAIEANTETAGTDAGQITVISVDCCKAGLTAIRDGKIYASVECTPSIGPLAVTTCERILEGKLKDKTVYSQGSVYKKADVTQAMIDAREY